MSSEPSPGGREVIKIYGNDKLSDRLKAFSDRVEKHKEKQSRNPFSSSFIRTNSTNPEDPTGPTSTGYSKHDPRYGQPPEGSKTRARGQAAHTHISKELAELCAIIGTYGEVQGDGSTIITFGELFQIYTTISNKVVGILLRGRKHGVLSFPGEMLYQRRDDEVLITLLPQDKDHPQE